MSISKPALICGSLLVVIGVIGSIAAMAMVPVWWYASIPALIGMPLIVCGWIATKGRGAWIIPMIIAPLIALVGVVGSFMPSGLSFSSPGSVAFVSSIFRLLTIITCSGFILMWLRALTAARDTRAD